MEPWNNPQPGQNPQDPGGYPGGYPGQPPQDYPGGYGGSTYPGQQGYDATQQGFDPNQQGYGGGYGGQYGTPPTGGAPWDQAPPGYGQMPGYGGPGYPQKPKRTGMIVAIVVGAVVVVGGAAVGIGIAASGGGSPSPNPTTTTSGTTNTSAPSNNGSDHFSAYAVSDVCQLVSTGTLSQYVPDEQCKSAAPDNGDANPTWSTNAGSSASLNGYLDVEVTIEPDNDSAQTDFSTDKSVDLEGMDTKISGSRSVTGNWDDGFMIDGTDKILDGEEARLIVRWGNVTADIDYTGGTYQNGSFTETPISQSQAEAAAEAVATDIRNNLK